MSNNSKWTRNRFVFTLCMLLFVLLITQPLWGQQGSGQKAPGFFNFWKLPRVWMSAVFSLIGLVLLMKSWVTRNIRLISLVVIFFVFAILSILPLGSFAKGMSMHPSPLCVIEKPFLFLDRGRGIPVIFLSIFVSVAILTMIGNKLFCGWACPLGAIQEIAHRIPLPKKLKIKLPFRITNSVRILIFILFIILLFSIGKSIYPYLNPFEFFHWGFGFIAVVCLVVTLIAAMFIFRPFCYVICPLGLFTWVFEHASLVRVKMDEDKCTHCNICVEKSPCPTVSSILDEKKSRPDCHPCGRCIEVCPENALKFTK